MTEGPIARGVIARLAAKRLALVREPEVSAESVAMIEDAAPAIAALEADGHTRSTPARKAARSECDNGPATAAEITAALAAQLKRLLTWQLREEPKLTDDVPWIRLCEEVFAVLVCSLALVRGTTSSPPDAELENGVVAEVSQAVADASETAVPEAVAATWHRWVRHMCRVAHGCTTTREPSMPLADESEASPTLYRVQARDHWPDALKAIVEGLEPDTERAIEVARRAKRCYMCGSVHWISRSGVEGERRCKNPPHEFYEALGREAFLIAYLAEKGAIEPSVKKRVRPPKQARLRQRRHSGDDSASGAAQAAAFPR